MSDYDLYFDDEYDKYEARFDPLNTDRQARRKRKPKVIHKPKKSQHEIINEIADPIGLEAGFETTYVPGIFEEEWLLSSLRDFYTMDFISDVLAKIRGGKEASVYRCQATPKTGMAFVAAKIYRPRKFRNLRNDKLYREGRAYLKADGKEIKTTDHRMMRAIGKKSNLGEQVQHTSWLMYEYTTLQTLHGAGADVPEPVAVADNAILMGYCGDEAMAAPTLNTVRLDAGEAQSLFERTLWNIELMLGHGLIHGDLSAYNILYWAGEITLIDFPQVIEYRTNTNAYAILQRDVRRICEYFADQSVTSDPQSLVDDLWGRYAGAKAVDLIADASTFEPQE